MLPESIRPIIQYAAMAYLVIGCFCTVLMLWYTVTNRDFWWNIRCSISKYLKSILGVLGIMIIFCIVLEALQGGLSVLIIMPLFFLLCLASLLFVVYVFVIPIVAWPLLLKDLRDGLPFL